MALQGNTGHGTRSPRGASASGGGSPGAPGLRRASVGSAGFTLIELLTVVLLIGILATVSLPYLSREDAHTATSGAAERVALTLRQARFRAISLRKPVYVHFEPDGVEDYYTAYVDLDDPSTVPTGTDAEIAATRIEFPDERSGWDGKLLRRRVLFGLGSSNSSPDPDADPPSDAIDLPENPIVFNARGTVEWPGGDDRYSAGVYVTHDDDAGEVRAVMVSRTGLIKVWTWTGDGWR